MSNVLNSGALSVYKKYFHINGLTRTTSSNPTYSLVASTGSINEGETVTYTFTTTGPDGTFYWVNNGNCNAADFTDNAMSGSFVTVNKSATFTRTAKLDLLTEPASENIQIFVKADSYSGSNVAGADIISIGDTSQTEYSLLASTGSVNEGSSISFTFTTTGDDETFYWTVNGSAADFTDGLTSGSFVTTAQTGSVTRTIKNDLLTEGTETVLIQFKSGSYDGTVLASCYFDIIDTSLTQYTLNVSTSSMDEGSSVTYTFTTTGPDGTFYWTNAGTTTASDFSDGFNSGSFAITSGTGSVSRTVLLDQLTEGSETIVFQVRSGSYSGSIVASNTITANDTSLTVYSLNASTGSLNEGSLVTYTFTTTGPNGTFYWTNSGTTVGSDFSDGFNSGSFTVTAGTGSVSRTLLADNLTEGNETIVFEVRSGSYAGDIISSTIVNVNDTSLTPWSPADLTNVRGWYKADTGLTLDASNNVTAWADQSGNSNNLSAAPFPGGAANNPPLYNSTGNPLSGPSIEFTVDFMRATSFSLGAASGSLSVIVIGKTATWVADTWLAGYFESASASANNVSLTNAASANSNKWRGIGGTSNSPASVSTTNATTNAVRIIRRNSSSQQIIGNGSVETTTANTKALTNTGGVFVVGARPAAVGTPALASTMNVYEIIIMRSYITDAEIASLQTYAQNKWGI